MFSEKNFKSTRNLKSKQIIFPEKLSSLDRKKKFILQPVPVISDSEIFFQYC